MSGKITPQQLARKFQQALKSGDPSAVASLYTEDATYREGSQISQGQKEIREAYAVTLGTFSDIDVEFWNILTCGEYFVYEGTWRGTHTGPLAGSEGDIPPTGRKVEIAFAFVAKVTPEGLVQQDHTYSDSAQMMEQLGLG